MVSPKGSPSPAGSAGSARLTTNQGIKQRVITIALVCLLVYALSVASAGNSHDSLPDTFATEHSATVDNFVSLPPAVPITVPSDVSVSHRSSKKLKERVPPSSPPAAPRVTITSDKTPLAANLTELQTLGRRLAAKSLTNLVYLTTAKNAHWPLLTNFLAHLFRARIYNVIIVCLDNELCARGRDRYPDIADHFVDNSTDLVAVNWEPGEFHHDKDVSLKWTFIHELLSVKLAVMWLDIDVSVLKEPMQVLRKLQPSCDFYVAINNFDLTRPISAHEVELDTGMMLISASDDTRKLAEIQVIQSQDLVEGSFTERQRLHMYLKTLLLDAPISHRKCFGVHDGTSMRIGFLEPLSFANPTRNTGPAKTPLVMLHANTVRGVKQKQQALQDLDAWLQ